MSDKPNHHAIPDLATRFRTALLTSLSTLSGDNRDGILNAMAARLRVTRADVDTLIDRLTAE